jgi:hypothetical protein
MNKLASLRPVACPFGVEPAAWRKALVARIDQQAAVLSALIDALDAMDGDCDLEANADDEPWLGWCKGGGGGNSVDLEETDQDSRDIVPIIDLGAM